MSSVKNAIFLLMISIILLSGVATVVAQYDNRVREETKDEENECVIEIGYERGRTLWIAQSLLLEMTQEESVRYQDEKIVVAATSPSRETSTRGASSRNNVTEYLPIEELAQAIIEEPVVELEIEEPQIFSEHTYIDARGMLRLINSERANYGLEPLEWSNSLTESARIRAREITVLFSHTRPDGRPWYTAGNSINGENLAARQRTLEIAFRAWMESPSHKANILNPNFTRIGIVGLNSPNTEHTYYWVQLFRR